MASNAVRLPPLDLAGASPAPRLHCRWCLAPVRPNDLYTVVLPLTGPFERKDLRGRTISIVLDGTPVDVFVPASFEGQGYAGSSSVSFACSERCQRDMRRCYAAAARPAPETRRRWFGAASPELESVRRFFAFEGDRAAAPERDLGTRPILDPRTRRKYERQLRNRCAYCLARLKADVPVVAIGAMPPGDPDRRIPGGRMRVVDIGGRPLAGYAPRDGSDRVRLDEMLFLLCSEACAAAFTGDVRSERLRRSFH